jgi:hypothetical protein
MVTAGGCGFVRPCSDELLVNRPIVFRAGARSLCASMRAREARVSSAGQPSRPERVVDLADRGLLGTEGGLRRCGAETIQAPRAPTRNAAHRRAASNKNLCCSSAHPTLRSSGDSRRRPRCRQSTARRNRLGFAGRIGARGVSGQTRHGPVLGPAYHPTGLDGQYGRREHLTSHCQPRHRIACRSAVADGC